MYALVLLTTSCSEEQTVTAPEEPDNRVELQLLPFVQDYREVQPAPSSRRRVGPPSGYTAYAPLVSPEIGVFVTEGSEMEEGTFAKEEGIWKTRVCISNGRNYNIYGYMPEDGVTGATIAPNGSYANGCVLTLPGLRTIATTDVCFVTGVKQAASSLAISAVDGLVPGAFGYTGKSVEDGNYIYMLFDHLYAAIEFNIKVDADYDALRTIKVRSMTVKSTRYTTGTATVTIAANPYGADPVTDVAWAYSSGNCEETIFAWDSSDPSTRLELTTSLQRIGSCLIVPGVNSSAGNSLMLRTVYDIYDKDGVLMREGQVSDNRIPTLAHVAHNERTQLNVTVKPTYLYVLGDNDLDNPDFTAVTD